ncbi:ABC transporter substrate-binding protein [Kribbella endophytica]
MAGLTRRTFLGFGAAAAAALTVPGCGGSDEASSDGLRVAWYGGDPVHKAMDAALKDFSTDLKLSTERAAFADYWDKLATQTAGRKGPDVFRMSMTYFAEYAQRKALLDLTDKGIKLDALDQDVADSGKIDGKLMGIGQSSITHATFRNPALVESRGGKLPATWSWDSFATFAKDFAADAGPGKYGTTDVGGNIQIFETWSREYGAELFADGKLAAGKDVIEAWFAYWDALRKAKAAPAADVSAEGGSFETSQLSKGAAPVEFGWVQQLTFYQPLVKNAELAVGAVPGRTPGSLRGQFLKALDFWSVSAETKNPEASAQLIDFLVNDDRAVKAIGLTLGVPPSKKSRDLLAAQPKTPAGQAIAYVEKIEQQVGPSPQPWPKGYGELNSVFNRLNQDIGFGKTDPKAAAEKFASESARVLGA